MRTLLALSLVVLWLSTAAAEETDLTQNISDLSSQTTDKEKMDTLGASKVEVSQIRTWLADATNAAKEEAQEKCRKLLELIRVQLKLVDELIGLSKVEDKARQLDQQVASARDDNEKAKRQLEEKQIMLRALKLKGE